MVPSRHRYVDCRTARRVAGTYYNKSKPRSTNANHYSPRRRSDNNNLAWRDVLQLGMPYWHVSRQLRQLRRTFPPQNRRKKSQNHQSKPKDRFTRARNQKSQPQSMPHLPNYAHSNQKRCRRNRRLSRLVRRRFNTGLQRFLPNLPYWHSNSRSVPP